MAFSNSTSRRLLLLFLLLLLILELRHHIIGRVARPLLILHILALVLINRLIRYHKIIVMLPSLHILFLGSDDSAPVFFISLTCYEPLSINDQFISNHLLHTF